MLSGISWVGGALGAQPTLALEPGFSAQAGTQANAVYTAAIGGESGQAVRVSGVRDFTRTVSGTHWRIGQSIARISGTQTAGLAALLLRSGTTNRGDVFLRNQNGGNWSLRGAAGGTTYLGQDTTVVSNGSGVYRLELEYTSDGTTHSIRLLVYYPTNTGGTPDQVFTGTVAGAVDNVRVLNPTGATGLTMDHGTLWFEDTGAPIWEDTTPAPVPGTVTFLTNVVPRGQTAIETSVKTANAETVQLEATPTGGGSPVVGAEVVPDEYGYAHPHVEGLTPNTSYSFRVLVDGVQRATGTNVWTLPPEDGPVSYRAGWGSCIDTANSPSYGLIAARNLRHFHFLGDDGYTNHSNSPFGSISPTDEPTRLLQREVWLTSAYQGTRPQLWSAMAVFPNYSDCDGAGGNADGTTGGHATGVVQAAFRRQYALPPLDLAEAACYVIPMGRVWEVHTDETADADLKTAPDTEAKLKLGAAQQAWLFDVIDAAKAAGVAILWFGDGPIVEPAGVGGATGNSWAKYHANLLVVTAYAKASGVPFRRLHSDTHTLFLDNGTNGPNGIPSISAAPVHTTAQSFGYPVSGEKWPASGSIDGARQYGVYEVTDDGDTITLEVWGYSSTASAPTEVVRFNEVYDITPPPTVTGAIAQTVPAVTSAASASIIPPSVTGTVTQTTPAVTSTGTGSITPPAVAGTISATVPAATSTASGAIIPPGVTGTVTSTVPAVTASATGAITPPPVTGAVQSTVPAVAQAATGTITDPPEGFVGVITAIVPAVQSAAAGTITPPSLIGQVAATVAAVVQAVVGVIEGGQPPSPDPEPFGVPVDGSWPPRAPGAEHPYTLD